MDLKAVSFGRLRRAGLLTRALAVLLMLIPAHEAFAQKPTESDVKAAYLFNFGKFLRWNDPAEMAKHGSFDICVLGRDDFHGALERLTANEQQNGLPERKVLLSSAVAARECAILFLSASELERVDKDLVELAGAPVLTVSDMPHFLEHGGMIQFETKGNHVRFAVSLDAANKVGLELSSQLLKVAVSVTGTSKREVP